MTTVSFTNQQKQKIIYSTARVDSSNVQGSRFDELDYTKKELRRQVSLETPEGVFGRFGSSINEVTEYGRDVCVVKVWWMPLAENELKALASDLPLETLKDLAYYSQRI